MTVIELGGREIKLTGSPMTPYFYKKEFGQSFSGDLAAMSAMETDLTKFDDVALLQMIWAMEKTTKMGKDMDPFVKWLSELEYVNLGEVLGEVVEEAMNATFREVKKSK